MESATKPQRIAHPFVIGFIAALWMTAAMLAHRLLFGISTVPGLITERIVPLVPGNISGTVLGALGQFSKLIPELSSIVAQLLVGGAVAIWYARSWGRNGAPMWKRWAFGPLVGLGLWALTLAALWPALYANYHGRPPAAGRTLTIIAVFFDYLLYGVLLPVFFVLKRRALMAETDDATEVGAGAGAVTRRHALSLVAAGAVVAFGAFAWGLRRISTLGYDGHRPAPPVQPITDNDSFYIVTNGLADPHVAANVWRLAIGGAVANPMTFSFDDLKALPAMDETTTLACIGNPLGGGLLSTAVWHGVPLQALIEMAKPDAGVTEVLFTASDDYTNTIEYDKIAAEGVIVAYGMNGEPLPQRHGFPVRIITPGRYGEKHVKWVTRIDLRTTHTKGFYESQGWDRTAVVKTLSRIDLPAKGDPVMAGQSITIKGIAFGGLRGVSKVEVTTDGGKAWQLAKITANPSPQSWVLWEFPWMPATSGETMLGVRCYEKDGTLQPTKTEQNFPSGAAGLDFVSVTVK
ncbi:MAG: molybdopterin-dependent oxidoreductase [Chloroflexota bacterium]|nr:molybdopterin-dependent oxidoreductase [Chloroflexota bacterium]MDQ6908010.1 molybdopterin-dependent oxidoreductase [Chloroflexota bacterium]